MPKIVADLHIHSKYSRATSKQMELQHLKDVAQAKGINVLGTGDFTHPLWFNDLKKLEEKEQGLFSYNNSDIRFILTAEISCIYSKNGKVRKLHMLVIAPSLNVVEKINKKLSKIGNLSADGRPILGLDAKELVKIVLDISEECLCIPCHIWTPWFGLLGSKSGFDSLEECFEDYSKYIFAVETGLSSDPKMNQRLSMLDRFSLISCSDAHSPQKLMREACVFDTDLNYHSIATSLKTKKGFLYTLEFFPEEGKYHADGHRNCNICLTPKETQKYHGICPKCKKPLTIGVLNRVEELADRDVGFEPPKAIPFKSLVPLAEIIANAFDMGVQTKKVQKVYDELMFNFNSELDILLFIPLDELKQHCPIFIAQGIIKVRQGNVKIDPGYDGVYGKVNIFSDKERQGFLTQKRLF